MNDNNNKKFNESFLSWFGNSKVRKHGVPLILYHGTSSSFNDFSFDRNRSELNKHYTGDGFFFTESADVASEYSESNRNQLFNKLDIFSLVKDRFPPLLANIFIDVVTIGYQEAWNRSEQFVHEIIKSASDVNVDINTLLDIASYVEGNNVDLGRSEDNGNANPLSLFFGKEYMPEWVKDDALSLGLGNAIPAPCVIPVYVRAENVLFTKSSVEAKSARRDGFDAVCFSGDDLVQGVREWIVYDNNNIKSAILNKPKFGLVSVAAEITSDSSIAIFRANKAKLLISRAQHSSPKKEFHP